MSNEIDTNHLTSPTTPSKATSTAPLEENTTQRWQGQLTAHSVTHSPWNREQEPSHSELTIEEKQALESQRHQHQHLQTIASMYMNRLGDVPLLTAEQEWALAEQLQQHIQLAWQEILFRPKAVVLLCQVLELHPEHPLRADLPHLTQLHRHQPLGKKRSERMQATLLRKILPLAQRCHSQDTDLQLLEEIIEHIRRTVFDRQMIVHEPGMRLTHQDRVVIERCRGQIIRIRNHFMRANLRLVVSVASRFHHHRMSLLDFIQEGNLGLLKAVHRFDHHKKFRFSTYAHWWIRQAIERAILNTANTIRLPGHIADAKRKMHKNTLALTQTLQRPPTRQEIAQHMELPESRVDQLLELGSEATSLDEQINQQDSRKLMDMMTDWSSLAADEAMIHESDRYQLRNILENLSPLERTVIRSHFGLDAAGKQTLQQIADANQLSRERVRQVEQTALRKIRRMIELQREQA